MQKQAPSFGRILAMVVFAMSCFGLLMWLWLSFGGPVPLKPQGYRVKAPFPEAATLAQEADVRMAGVTVGKVKTKELQKAAARTLVEMELDESISPIPKDSRAILRQKTLLGETYVEISPGSKASIVTSAPMNGCPSPTTMHWLTSAWARSRSSSTAGATFLPPAVTISSFFRPVIRRNPASSSSPMSPVWNQPSSSASAVAASFFQYRRKTIGPLTSTSPSSAMRTEWPGTGRPTVPMRWAPSALSVTPAVVSVRP